MKFQLDEARAAEVGFAERFPVEDDHSAMLAIDQAIAGDDDIVITGPEGPSPGTDTEVTEMAVDLLADGDGKIDGFRILVRLPGGLFWRASEIQRVPWGGQDTLAVLRVAVAAANGLLDASEV
jgi:hypothetical protein